MCYVHTPTIFIYTEGQLNINEEFLFSSFLTFSYPMWKKVTH